jgi:hypothetical protein
MRFRKKSKEEKKDLKVVKKGNDWSSRRTTRK